MTNQEKEIATIRERKLTLKLSDADVKRITDKAEANGLTVAELLENFIGDLVGGTYTNGSDEGRLADEYFNRCWFGMFPDRTPINYAIEEGCIDLILDLVGELEGYETEPEDFVEEIADVKEELQEIYQGYTGIVKDPKSYDDFITDIKAYNERLAQFMG